jgi:hypothetical protein
VAVEEAVAVVAEAVAVVGECNLCKLHQLRPLFAKMGVLFCSNFLFVIFA